MAKLTLHQIIENNLRTVLGKDNMVYRDLLEICDDPNIQLNTVKANKLREKLLPYLNDSDIAIATKAPIYETIQQIVHDYHLNDPLECPFTTEEIDLAQSTATKRSEAYAYSCVSGRIYTKANLVEWLNGKEYGDEKTDPITRSVYSAYELEQLDATPAKAQTRPASGVIFSIFNTYNNAGYDALSAYNKKIIWFGIVLTVLSASCIGGGINDITTEIDEDYTYQQAMRSAISGIFLLAGFGLCYRASQHNKALINAQSMEDKKQHQTQFDNVVSTFSLLIFIPAYSLLFPQYAFDAKSISYEASMACLGLSVLYIMKTSYQYYQAQFRDNDDNHCRKLKNSDALLSHIAAPTFFALIGTLIGGAITGSHGAAYGGIVGLGASLLYYSVKDYTKPAYISAPATLQRRPGNPGHS